MIGRVEIAPDGVLWVQRFSVGDSPGLIDLFAPGGEYLATLPNDAPFPIGFLPDGRILTAETDEFDIQRLAIRSVELRF